MKLARNDRSIPQDTFFNAVDYYAEVRRGLREKADHNKREAQYTFYALICFTLTAPLFVTLGQGIFFAKIVPATLSVLTAAASAWLQLRKPQRLWAIYRRAQRELEREKAAYDFGLDPYDSDLSTKDKLLAKRVSEIAFAVHEQWEGLVPEADSLPSITPSVPVGKIEDKV